MPVVSSGVYERSAALLDCLRCSAFSMRRLGQLIPEALWVVAGQGASLLGAFVTLKLTVSWLEPSEYGHFALGLGLLGALGVALFGPLSQVGLRFFPAWRQRDELPSMRAEMMLAAKRVVMSGVVLAFLLAATMYFWRGTEWFLLVLTAGFGGLAAGLGIVWSALLNAARKRRGAALLIGGDPWLRLTGAALAGWLGGWTALNLLLGYALGAMTAAAWGARQAMALMVGDAVPRAASQDEFRRQAWAYALPFVFFAVCAAGIQLDRWVLEAILTLEDVGYYAAILQVASAPATFLVTVVGWIVAPVVFEVHEKGMGDTQARGLVLKSVLFYSVFCLPIAVVFALWGASLLRLLTNSAVAAHAGLLWIMFLAMAVFQGGQLLVTEGLRQMHPRRYILSKSIHVVVLLGLCWALGLRFGLVGAAWALLFASLGYFVAVVFANRQAQYPATHLK
jgi:O-antigen/teichoic acid export membrane protein